MDVNEHTVHGWYGTKTSEDYKQRLGLREERRRRKESERRVEAGERRRALVRANEGSEGVGRVSSENGGREGGGELFRVETKKSQKEGRLRRLSRVLTGGRRATLA